MHFTLLRTGDRPLTFTGALLTGASSRVTEGDARWRWHEITLYRTDDSRYVVEIDYHSTWGAEAGYHSVKVCDDLAAVVARLRGHDPLQHFVGPPVGGSGSPQEGRLARLRCDLRLRYETAVAAVLEGFPEELATEGDPRF
jgi:hypothetical protein